MPATTPKLALPYPVGTDPIDVAGDVKRLAEAVDTNLDGVWLPLTGGTVTGPLVFQNTLTLQRSNDDVSFAFAKMDGTSMGYLRVLPAQMDISTTAPLIRLICSGVSELEITPTQVRIPSNELSCGVIRSSDIVNSGNITNTSGTLTNTGPVNVAGVITADGSPSMRVKRTGAPLRPYIDFFSTVVQATIVGADTALEITANTGGISFRPGALGQKFELDGTGTYAFFGKASSNLGADGMEFIIGGVSTGSMRSTLTNVTMNLYANHMSAANVNGSNFAQFAANSTPIGNISQSGTTGTNYGTTSHGPYKGNVTDIDDDAALAAVEALRPVNYQWKLDAGGNLREDGTPTGDVQTGFIAQELAAVAPIAVIEGKGTEVEFDAWKQEYEAYTAAMEARSVDLTAELPPDPGDSPFIPWMTDNAKLVPTLTAATRALVHKLTTLEAFNAQLISALTAVLDPANPATAASLTDLLPGG